MRPADPARPFRDRSVLVTGAAGFIGSHLAERLAWAGARVTAVDRLAAGTGARRENLAAFERQSRLLIGDLRDPDLADAALANAEVVFHLAGRTGHEGSMHDPMADLRDNVEATLALLEAWSGGDRSSRFVFASTRQVYGRTGPDPVSEDHPTVPTDVNGWNKLAAEGHFAAYHSAHDLQVTVVRPTNTYGPRMSVANGVLGAWLTTIADGEAFLVYGDGSLVRQVTYVDDVVDALLLCGLHAEGYRLYNLGGLESHSLREIADALVELGAHYELVPCPDLTARIGVGDFLVDDRRIRRELGWAPRVDLRTGLERTLSMAKPGTR